MAIQHAVELHSFEGSGWPFVSSPAVALPNSRQINLNSMNWPGHKSLPTVYNMYSIRLPKFSIPTKVRPSSSPTDYTQLHFSPTTWNGFSYCALLLSTFSKMFIGGLSWQTSPGKWAGGGGWRRRRGESHLFIYLLCGLVVSYTDWSGRMDTQSLKLPIQWRRRW